MKKSKKRAWDQFSKYIRLRDAIKTTNTKTKLICISCDKIYPAFGIGCAQAGHLIPGRGNSVLINERFVNGQCYNCNFNLKGNWVAYEAKMIEMYGKKEVELVKATKGKVLKRSIADWKEIELEYKEKYDKMYQKKL